MPDPYRSETAYLTRLLREKEEARLRLYGVLWLLVTYGVISESRARELGDISVKELQDTLKELLETDSGGT